MHQCGINGIQMYDISSSLVIVVQDYSGAFDSCLIFLKKLHIVSVYCEFVTKLIYFLITCFHGVAYQNEIPSGWKLFWLWWNSYLSFPWHESAKSRILRGLCRWLRWGQLWACIVHSFFKMLLFESLMYTLSQKSSHLLTVCNFVKF